MLKSYGVGSGWWVVGGGGLQDFSVSPSRVLLGLIGLELGWIRSGGIGDSGIGD